MFSLKLADGTDVDDFTARACAHISAARDVEDARMLVKLAAEAMVNQAVRMDPATVQENFLAAALESYHAEQQETNKNTVWYSPNSFGYLLAPTEAGTLIRVFSSNHELRDAFAELPEVEPFNFSRFEDAPDGVSEADWHEHQQMCQRIHDSINGRWSDNGDSYNIHPEPWIEKSLLNSTAMHEAIAGGKWPTKTAMADLVMREHGRRHGKETVRELIHSTICQVMDIVVEHDGAAFLRNLLPPLSMELLTGPALPEIDRMVLDAKVAELADKMPQP